LLHALSNWIVVLVQLFHSVYAMNQSMNPDRRSNRQSSIDAINAMDTVSTEAMTFLTKRIRLIIFDKLIATVLFFVNC